jgi:starch synthase
MKKERKILLASTEVVPFAKTGGLADVVGALPKALEKVGAEVTIVMPKYGSIDEKAYKLKKTGETFKVPMAGEMVDVSLKVSKMPDCKATVYFIECDKYFGYNGLYQENGHDYPNNDERFALFSRAVIEMLKVLKYKPDVIHCNDWQTGLIPTYLKVLYGADKFYKGISTVMTIHNIAYQGIFDKNIMDKIGLPWEVFTMEGVEFWGQVSYLKAGLVYADVINTVSETYAKEIKTTSEFGRGMEGLLMSRSDDLYGILNGIDYDLWDPAKDDYLASSYDSEDLRGKSRCKKALQKEHDMPTDNHPLIGITSRLDDQKGFDLVAAICENLMAMDCQLVILGTGDLKYHELLTYLGEKYAHKTGINLKFDNELAHRIYAGSDIFLMPSRYEPCGLGQMISLKYGTLPVVNHTGGLADTVWDYTDDPDNGNGFVFTEYSPEALLDAVTRAVETFENKRKWNTIVKRCMEMDFSWKSSASKYMELYEKAMDRKMTKV